MEVYKKLMKVQSDLKVPKSQFNSFGKYNYRSCEDILEALKPILLKNSATLVISDEIVNIGDRFYVKATARFIDVETTEVVEISALAREDENKKGQDLSQVTGSTSSYARKYALNGLFCIDDTKDSDATNKHGKEDDLGKKPPTPQPSDTLERAKAVEINFGKNSGKKLGELDNRAIKYYADNANDEKIKKAAQYILSVG